VAKSSCPSPLDMAAMIPVRLHANMYAVKPNEKLSVDLLESHNYPWVVIVIGVS